MMEKKTYKITFMADLTEDDVRAMKKCFYDAMLESMEISPVWNLKLEEVNSDPEEPESTDLPAWNFQKYEPSLEELLKLPMRHVQCVRDCFEACKSKLDVRTVLERIPKMLGSFEADFDDELQVCYITHTYFDDDDEEIEEEYCYVYPEDWDWSDEEE